MLTYTGLLIDRKPNLREREDEILALRGGSNALILPVCNGKFFFKHHASSISSLTSEECRVIGLPCYENIFLGMDSDQAWFVLEVDQGSVYQKLLEIGVFESLNNRIGYLPAKFAALLAYARGMILWKCNNLFCGRCGSVTVGVNGGPVRLCQNRECSHKSFPRTDPAVITLVEHPDGQHCLLGRQRIWPEGMYSIVAGFLEIGESIEECVIREVYEESGLIIKNPKLKGIITFPKFDEIDDWLVFVYTANNFEAFQFELS